ncbi:MAG: phytanoyl-CoA dioxygenase family protein [Ferruginibacter sp.]
MEYPILSASQVGSLTRIWQKAIHPDLITTDTWDKDLGHVYDLEIGMQEMLLYLYTQQPDLINFLQWANEKARITETANSIETDVLSETDIRHWRENGYVVLREAATKQEHINANKAIWKFLGASPEDPASWYKQHTAMSGLMVVFTQHEALHATRNSTRIRRAFEQLYGNTAIKKIIDKVSFNPPQTDQYTFKGSPLHWDTSLELPIPERFQGLLYLTNVTETGGAFQCVPGFHRQINEWIDKAPPNIDLRRYALETLQPVPVPGNAGDLIIWHQALPHCASANLGQEPRLVQYLTYIPDNYEDRRAWI